MNLTNLSDDALFTEAVAAITAAAAGEARGGDDFTYSRAMEFLKESQRRCVEAGHTRNCHGGIYNRAYEQAEADSEYRTSNPPTCSCGKDA
jgi:hypothetical protein